MARVVLLAALVVAASPIFAQTAQPGVSDPEPPRLVPGSLPIPAAAAVEASAAIQLDGRLSEPAWGQAPAATGFIQREPRPGLPATEETEFRVLYDARGLYFGIRAYDREPGRLVRDLHGRDVIALQGRNDYWGDDDTVSILLDTFLDRRNAYYFSVNPNGSKTDALVTGEGQTRNFDWQGVWEAAATVDEQGWTAEIFIPWTTLRFPPVRTPRLGLNVQRVIRRKSEETFWAPLSLDESLWWMSKAGHLDGVTLPKTTRTLELKPFATGSWSRGASFGGSARDLEPGVDVKIGITDGLTADVTYNTDFAQVEVDAQQVNLTRFPLFFPEKREFFLENSGLFEVGVERLVQLFFSRRIGLDEGGEPVPIAAGGRLTGRLRGFELGALYIQTEATGTVPRARHTVLRLRRNFLRRSTAGVLFTDFSQGADGTGNRLVAVDVDLNPWRYLGFNAYLAKSASEGVNTGEWSTGGILHWNTDAFGARVVFVDHQENFRPGLGFLPRGSLRQYQPGARYVFRPRGGLLRTVLIRGVTDRTYDRDWVAQSLNSWMHTIVTLDSGDELQVQYNHRFEHVDRTFRIHTVAMPAGDFTFGNQFVRMASSAHRRLSVSARYEWGGFYSGRRESWNLQGTLKAGAHLAFLPRYERNRVQLPQGAFVTNLAGVRVNVAPTNRLTFNAFLQYNDAIERLTTNVRVDVIYRPGSNLFFVYNERRDLLGGGWPIEDRQHLVKFTYLWRR